MIRLQKFMASRGYGSRRACEELIRSGRVFINSQAAVLGNSINPETDLVEIDGTPVPATAPPKRVLLLYKPRGFQCTAARISGRTVFDLLPPDAGQLRISGRLDKDSEGLVLLTNDGELLQKFSHPRHNKKKTYLVSVGGRVDPEILVNLRMPLKMPDGYITRPAIVRIARNATSDRRVILEFILGEGRNRQVRRLCERAGLKIYRLTRTKIGDFTVRGLQPGQWRELAPKEIQEIISFLPSKNVLLRN